MVTAEKNARAGVCAYILTAALLAVSLVLTFTVSDYYIFNRVSEYGFLFVLCQWVKKAGLLLAALAVFYKKRGCADAYKYIVPACAIISCFTFGNFFNISAADGAVTQADLVYASINGFVPPAVNAALFFIANALYLCIAALLFVRDGFAVRLKSLKYFPLALVACMPLNIFENFFDISSFPEDSFWRFRNFTVWHLLAIIVLIAFTVGWYLYLKHKERRAQDEYLVAMAIVLLIQYHSKDSMVMGDGYNIYHTVFACIPLFICNIGVYCASLSVILKKRVLYNISFFIHAAGAVTVFVYFGRDDMSDYGIICSHSILYFCLTHCLLFALSVLPTALGRYRFTLRECAAPLVYYLVVVVVASVAAALVTSASMQFSYDGYTLSEGEWLYPNYAFTQINPLPFDVPKIPLRIWRYELNILYILGLYAVYVGIFFVFYFAYRLYLVVLGKIFGELPAPSAYSPESGNELAAADVSGISLTSPDTERAFDLFRGRGLRAYICGRAESECARQFDDMLKSGVKLKTKRTDGGFFVSAEPNSCERLSGLISLLNGCYALYFYQKKQPVLAFYISPHSVRARFLDGDFEALNADIVAGLSA